MSNLLFVRRNGRHGDLQYCVPQGYEWTVTDEENTQKRIWSLGPWQRVKLSPPPIVKTRSNSLHKHGTLHINAPFCSIVSNEGHLPAKLKAKAPTLLDKQKTYTHNEKAKIKARRSTVLPVVALSKNGEWVSPAFGRKAHARLVRNSGGGWSNRFIPALDGSAETVVDVELIDNERQYVCLDKPELYSSALLLRKLQSAEEELKRARTSIRQASVHLGCARQGFLDEKKLNASRGFSRVTTQHDGRRARNHKAASNQSKHEGGFSIRASRTGT